MALTKVSKGLISTDTVLLMSNRDWVVNVESSRFDDVMTACVAENIFTSDRVAQFKRGVRQISEPEYRFPKTKPTL